MKSGFVQANNAKFYYEMDGSGVPLVLVHAGIADNRMWNDQFQVFAEKYQTIRYDRRGFGKTKMVAGDFSLHNDLYEVLKALGIERAILLGCSQGGKTVTNFALEHPEMTKALILVGAGLGGFDFDAAPSIQEEQIEKAEQAGDLDLVNELELQIWVDGPQRTPEQVDPEIRELVRNMNRIALETPQDLGNEIPLEPAAANRLSEIKVPTLVMVGDYDPPWILTAADFLAKHITNAKKVTMNDVAHLPNMEKPEEFNGHVLSFFKTNLIKKELLLMPLDTNYKQLNLASTERIKKFISLTNAEMQTRVGEHWTVAIALAHIGFWDRRVMYCLDRTEQEGKLYIPEIEIAVNDLSLPFWAVIPSKDALRLAIENSEAVDKRLENYPQNLLEEVYNFNERWVIRALHRNMHLDEVDTALKAAKK